MKFSEFNTDIESEENGKWFVLGDGARIKLRSFQSKRSQEVRDSLESPYLALKRAGRDIPKAEQEALLIKQMAQAIVVDWEGMEGDDGNALPYSASTAEKQLTTYREFRNLVARLVTDDDAFKAQALEDAEKN